ncbi:MAG: S8 family serine peptidase, partial [Gammaproteobacteria bacterium]|nr:S8 family serine peptidase [Gammaproteobacteria bacterium]
MSKRATFLAEISGFNLVNGTAVFALVCLLCVESHADPRAEWLEPFNITLPEVARTILLRRGADARSLARDLGLQNYTVLSRGSQGSILETRMNEDDWQRLQQSACKGASFGDWVEGCETASCQAVQLQGDATPASAQDAQQVQARLVRNPPELVDVPDDADLEAGTCSGMPLIPPLAGPGAAGPGDLVLDLQALGGSRDVSAPDGQRQQSEPTSAVAADVVRRSFEFVLDSRFNPNGGMRLGTDELPADTSEWSLVVAARCSEVSVPLDSLAPAREPGLVLAIVVGGNAADVASTYNLQVVREVTLESTAETLAVFSTVDNVSGVIALLLLDARVVGAQPEFIYRTSAEPGVRHSDPFAWLTYGPEKTGAIGLHGEIGGAGQLVAVIDTGVDVEHPELKGRIREYMDVSERGWSADAHGTAVVGIIAANADNGIGSYGVAPKSEILALKACQPEDGGLQARCWTSTLVKALDVAMVKDAGVINMSLTGPPDDLLARYVGLAIDQNRVVVAAAGNGGPNAKPGFPAALPGVLAVTAVDAADGLYAKANLGDYIDVAAPGVDIVAPAPNGDYPPLSGTSMAAAHVSGVATLLRELVPMMGGVEIVALLTTNVSDLGAAGRDKYFGAGL